MSATQKSERKCKFKEMKNPIAITTFLRHSFHSLAPQVVARFGSQLLTCWFGAGYLHTMRLCSSMLQIPAICLRTQSLQAAGYLQQIIEVLESYEEGTEPRTNAMDLGE